MILRSKYLIDWAGRIVKDAEIELEAKRIGAIRKKGADPAVSDSDVMDLGCAALFPGFVNAHTHLELSMVQSQIKSHRRFTDWIREVVHVTSEWGEDTFDSSLGVGIARSVESGTTSLGDISRGAGDVHGYLNSGMRVCLFNEVIDFNPQTARQTLESLRARISRHPAGEKLLIGVAPHSAYTVSERLLKQCIELAHENDLPLCIHLAETKAELKFLRSGAGEILEFRKDFGLPPEWKPPRASPVRYLQRLGLFERPATLIHCNYVEEKDFEVIARSNSSVVFCPHSHQYFGHQEHPFLKMLEHEINVALGTDSLISSPTLSMLDEMKFLYDEFPEIEPIVLLQMATTNGLKALRLPPDVGPLEPGCYADLVGVALPEDEIEEFDSVLEALLSKRSKVVFSMVGGEVLFETRRSTE